MDKWSHRKFGPEPGSAPGSWTSGQPHAVVAAGLPVPLASSAQSQMTVAHVTA